MKNKIEGVIAALIANAFFGIAVVWTKQSFETYTPLASSLGRVLVAIAGLLLYGLIAKQITPLKKKDVYYFILCGFFVPFLFYVFVYEGIVFIDAVVAGIIFATMPLMSPLASHIFFKTKFHKLFFVGMVISFFGVIISVTSDGFDLDASPLGIVLMLLGVMSYVLFTVMIKKLAHRYTNTSIILYSSMVGAVLLFVIFMIFEYPTFIHQKHSFTSTMAIVYMGLFSSFLGFVLYAHSIKVLGVGNGMMFFNLVPIFTAIGAYFILGEDIPDRKLLGMFVVILGLYLTMMKIKKKKVDKE